MLSGVKFIPRDELDHVSSLEEDSELRSSRKEKKKSRSRKEKNRTKNKRAYHDSSDGEGTERKKKRSSRKKWHSSDASSLSRSENESESFSDRDEEGNRKRKKASIGKHNRQEAKNNESSGEEVRRKLKKKLKRNKHNSSEDSLSSDESGSSGNEDQKGRKEHKRSHSKTLSGKRALDMEDHPSDGGRDMVAHDDKQLARKEMGLEWMLKPVSQANRMPKHTDDSPEELQVEEVKKPNPRELNPYLKEDGSGYPEDASQTTQLLPTSVVGDGGASWRLKALKRAKEQAAREGRKLDEIVEERWGSLGELAVSVASHRAAPARAHLHAIKDRRERTENYESVGDDKTKKVTEKARAENREHFRDPSFRRSQMKEPKVRDSLSWGKRKSQKMSIEDTRLISEAASHLNKYENDGSFFSEFNHQKKDVDGSGSSSRTNYERNGDLESELISPKDNHASEGCSVSKQVLSANQLAAKVLQLRMKGKHEEAEKLLKESETMIVEQDTRAKTSAQDTIIRYGGRKLPSRQKRKEDDADMYLAATIVQNKQYSMSGRADDEYDFDDAPSKKQRRKKGGELQNRTERAHTTNRLLTQQERCNFCFENPNRPKHLVVSIANFTYLMLSQWQHVVEGHCCILTLQHESATRSVDNNVWEEIRNFKKCLIMMFAKQEKEVVFLETVMGLAQQRRHCLVECIPLPHEIAKEAPLYFKKAIDEAEEEWSQHNAKKLIDTSEKGLRASIPKDFPYFHVEFGLNKGFVHVIDDERQFKSNLGLNVIRGMLQVPEEDMYRRRKMETVEAQRQAVTMFAREWEPFDWTKQLD